MNLLIVFLSFILVLNAAFLTLLILIQLPKKEAGAGLAFGAGATDALFGAGSGNALTKMTKYTATVFLGLVLALSILGQRVAREGSSEIESLLQKRAGAGAPLPITPAVSSNATPASTNAPTNLLQMTVPVTTNSTAPATTVTLPPATPPANPPTTSPAEPQK